MIIGDSRKVFRPAVRHPPLTAVTMSVIEITPQEEVMRTRYAAALVLLAGFGLGVLASQDVRAQAKPPVYTVFEIDVTNVEAYTKEYAPLAQASIRKSGGKQLAGGQKVTSLEGAPPKPRVTIHRWDSLEQAQAWFNSADYRAARKIGDKYATFRAFAVEGLPE